MPGYDGTGPAGQGSMTGRGLGYCVVPLNPYVKTFRPVRPSVMTNYTAPDRPFNASISRYPVANYFWSTGRPRLGYARGLRVGRGRGRRGRGRW